MAARVDREYSVPFLTEVDPDMRLNLAAELYHGDAGAVSTWRRSWWPSWGGMRRSGLGRVDFRRAEVAGILAVCKDRGRAIVPWIARLLRAFTYCGWEKGNRDVDGLEGLAGR